MPNIDIYRLMPLRAQLPDFDVDWLDQTGSTNADLLARIRTEGVGGRSLLLGADLQTQGRGRAGKAWDGARGAALSFSCAFNVAAPASRLPSLSPLAGVIACEALRGLAVERTRLCMKWPNDIQWDDAKLAGILVESCRARAGYSVVIGIGLNLTGGAALSAALGRDIAAWDQVGSTADAFDIVVAIADAWRRAIQTFQTEGFTPFMERFDSVDVLAGREVNVIERGRTIAGGNAKGCDESGRLLVREASGAMFPVTIGEISVRRAP